MKFKSLGLLLLFVFFFSFAFPSLTTASNIIPFPPWGNYRHNPLPNYDVFQFDSRFVELPGPHTTDEVHSWHYIKVSVPDIMNLATLIAILKSGGAAEAVKKIVEGYLQGEIARLMSGYVNIDLKRTEFAIGPSTAFGTPDVVPYRIFTLRPLNRK